VLHRPLAGTFYDPQSGIIKIGGKDITQLALTDPRRHLALVSQVNARGTTTLLELSSDRERMRPAETLINAASTDEAQAEDFVLQATVRTGWRHSGNSPS